MPTAPLADEAPSQGADPGQLPGQGAGSGPLPGQGAGQGPLPGQGAGAVPRPDLAPRPAARPARFAPALAVAVLGLALLLYYPTLGASWAYDDIDYINQAADCMAGKLGFLDLLLRPQGEHVVAGFRLALYASLKLFGIAAFPY